MAVSADTLAMLEACIGLDRAHGRRVPAPRRRRADRLGLPPQPARRPRRSPLPSPPPRRLDGRIEIDRRHGTVRIPRGTRLDLGGIAKSWMAGRAAALRVRALRRPGRDGRRRRRPGRGPRRPHRRGRGRRARRPAPEAAGQPPVLAHVVVRAGQGVATSGLRPPPMAQRRRPRGPPPDRPRHRRARAGHARDRRQRRPGRRRRAGQGARRCGPSGSPRRPRRPWCRSTATSARRPPGSGWCGDDPVGRRPGERVRRLRLLHARGRLGDRALRPLVEAAGRGPGRSTASWARSAWWRSRSTSRR